MIIGIVVIALFAIGWLALQLMGSSKTTESSEHVTSEPVHFSPLAIGPTMLSEIKPKEAEVEAELQTPADCSVDWAETLPDNLPDTLLDTTVVMLESSDGTVIDPLELQLDDRF